MHDGYSSRYGTRVVVITDLVASDKVIAFANEIGAIHYTYFGEYYVVRFPNRPDELYIESELRALGQASAA